MPINSDSKKDIAIKILSERLNITPAELIRFTTGYAHSVYHVKTEYGEYVLRITSKQNKSLYFGSIKWLNKLAHLDIPIPKVLEHGQYEDKYYVLMTFIRGRDLGEVYHTLSDSQKREIAKSLCEIQRKIATLPSSGLYGYDSYPTATWSEEIAHFINRSRKRIMTNKVFDAKVCDDVAVIMSNLSDYFSSVQPIAFLDDTTTKNVLIHDGALSGIVDIDWICYGGPLQTIGLTNMSLLAMGADTKYIDYWLDEMSADSTQHTVVTFYTLLFCIDFMGEQGMRFDNDNIVEINQEKVELLSLIYDNLISKLR